MPTVPVYTIALRRQSWQQVESRQLRTSKDAATLLRDYLAEVDREHFVVFALNRKNRLIGINTVSIGSISASVVHPREVLKFLILSNAAAFICGHNHPSGDVQPSGEDKTLTQRLLEAARVCGIEMLDHVIIGDGTDTYMSFADEGLLRSDQPMFVTN